MQKSRETKKMIMTFKNVNSLKTYYVPDTEQRTSHSLSYAIYNITL